MPPQLTERQDALLVWFADRQRDLPWRRTRDPWRVLVSELMLQQTQVARVIPKYEAFVARWPTAAACAADSASEVVKSWRGLGYNQRAINLHRAATEICERHSGVVPNDLASLLHLRGVGPYTARAVMAFAFEQDVGVVDVNAARVLARWAAEPMSAKAVQIAADAEVPDGRGWEWNQAMLDLGASTCTARKPACDSCPVSTSCGWFRLGNPEPDPAVASALTTRPQSRFQGSDRQGRGRLIDALRQGPVDLVDVAEVMGWVDDAERATRVVDGLIRDGLAVEDGDTLSLPR